MTNNNNSDKAAEATTSATAEKKTPAKPAPDEPAAQPEPTPLPQPVQSPAPAPKPAPRVLTAADCTGYVTAYVIAANGAEVSYRAPDNWSTVTTYPYGSQLTVYCKTGDSAFSPEYGLVADAFIKMNLLSRTAP